MVGRVRKPKQTKGMEMYEKWLLGGATAEEQEDYHAFVRRFPEFRIK